MGIGDEAKAGLLAYWPPWLPYALRFERERRPHGTGVGVYALLHGLAADVFPPDPMQYVHLTASTVPAACSWLVEGFLMAC
jgi:hypothetical protein